MTADANDFAAASLERECDAPCGGCGRHHVASAKDIKAAPPHDICHCACCDEAWFELFKRDLPQAIECRGGRLVVSEAAVERENRRLAAELGLTDADVERLMVAIASGEPVDSVLGSKERNGRLAGPPGSRSAR
jgi:hypothetical protein